jgi:hypothetical protein
MAAFGLAAVGMTMNGWFARSLGSSDIAGWLFLAIGVGADLVALAVPSCAARLWQARQRATSLAGWAIWAMTFAFAVTARHRVRKRQHHRRDARAFVTHHASDSDRPGRARRCHVGARSGM